MWHTTLFLFATSILHKISFMTKLHILYVTEVLLVIRLLTPPGTPLFPNLENETHISVKSKMEIPNTRSTALKPRVRIIDMILGFYLFARDFYKIISASSLKTMQSALYLHFKPKRLSCEGARIIYNIPLQLYNFSIPLPKLENSLKWPFPSLWFPTSICEFCSNVWLNKIIFGTLCCILCGR